MPQSTPGLIVCLAGCDAAATTTVATPLQKDGSILASVGPIEVGRTVKTASIAPNEPSALPLHASNVITCLAGCDDNDRRVMSATGGPSPTLSRQPAIPPRLMMAAAAPKLDAPVTKSVPKNVATPVKLKRTLSAHKSRLDRKAKAASPKSTAKPVMVRNTDIPRLATAGVPTPIKPAPEQSARKSPALVTKAKPLVSPQKPVSVKTSSDWFNKITREQAAKKAETAAQ